MQITRTTDCGIRILTHLAALPRGARLTAAELARRSHASQTAVAKILQRLAASRLVISHRGFEGGFELGREPRAVSVLDIVTVLEGPLCLNASPAGGAGWEEATRSSAIDVWARAQSALARVLADETLERLAAIGVPDRATCVAVHATTAAR